MNDFDGILKEALVTYSRHLIFSSRDGGNPRKILEYSYPEQNSNWAPPKYE
jgi:hypothetical protein